MALFDEFRGSTDRFKHRIEEIQDLLRQNQIDGVRRLVQVYRQNDVFRSQWHSVWLAIARDDGGKLSLGTAGAILGAVLGGAGIAAMGSAIGVPLLAVLGLGGLVAGSEVDAVRRRWSGDSVSIDIPRSLHDRLAARADVLGLEPRQLLEDLLHSCLD